MSDAFRDDRRRTAEKAGERVVDFMRTHACKHRGGREIECKECVLAAMLTFAHNWGEYL